MTMTSSAYAATMPGTELAPVNVTELAARAGVSCHVFLAQDLHARVSAMDPRALWDLICGLAEQGRRTRPGEAVRFAFCRRVPCGLQYLSLCATWVCPDVLMVGTDAL